MLHLRAFSSEVLRSGTETMEGYFAAGAAVHTCHQGHPRAAVVQVCEVQACGGSMATHISAQASILSVHLRGLRGRFGESVASILTEEPKLYEDSPRSLLAHSLWPTLIIAHVPDTLVAEPQR